MGLCFLVRAVSSRSPRPVNRWPNWGLAADFVLAIQRGRPQAFGALPVQVEHLDEQNSRLLLDLQHFILGKVIQLCRNMLPMRRGGRVVDRVALEMRSTRKRTGGSNPSLSATYNYLISRCVMPVNGR
jgi:hypothetical protein